MKRFSGVLINSTILFVCAATLEMTLHELGHFAAAILVHAKNVTLHHNFVSTDLSAMPTSHAVFYSGAGPLVSLLIGLCFHLVCYRQKKRGLFFLFNLYMAVFGYIGFLGYLAIAPFFTYGDTGYIFQTLHFPTGLTIVIAIVGGLMLYFIISKLMKFFVEMGTSNIVGDKKSRRMFMRALICYPLCIGIVITTLLNLPVPSTLNLICPIFSPFTLMWAYGKAIAKRYPTDNMSTDINEINKIQPVWLIILFLTIVLNRFLVCGINVN